jgi:hypothetical protein
LRTSKGADVTRKATFEDAAPLSNMRLYLLSAVLLLFAVLPELPPELLLDGLLELPLAVLVALLFEALVLLGTLLLAALSELAGALEFPLSLVPWCPFP